ncbi:MAG: GNAT family N-acetyltransferase, partial [bacterium]
MAFAPEQKPAPLAVKIRDMQIADVAEVYAIEIASYSQPWPLSCFLDELTKNHFAQYCVAESEGQVIGYAGQWAIADEGHITTIAVDYGFRRRRVAEQLLVGQI